MLEKLNHIFKSTQVLLPDLMLIGSVLVIILGLTLSKYFNERRLSNFFLALSVITLISLGIVYFHSLRISSFQGFLYNQFLYLDNLSYLFKVLICVAGILILLQIWIIGYKVVGEIYAILLSMIVGLFMMVSTTHLLTMYVSIEMVSLCSYMLVALNPTKLNSEAGIKYLIFGATSSAIMLYGISWLYGMTGSLNFESQEFVALLSKNPTWIIFCVIALTMSGLFFKLAAAPFHVWSPDVYEAAPTPIVAFFSIAPKAAAILLIIRFLNGLNFDYTLLLAIVILVSLTIGNLSALWQTNTKRMLAYSSIAHAGFMLVGLLSMSEFGIQATIFYIATYLFITIAAFVLADLLALKTDSYEIAKLAGLGQGNVFLGIAAVVIMVALVGLPPTVGFTGKLLIFSALWENFQTKGDRIVMLVLIFGVLNTVISIFYYLKIPYVMIFKQAQIGTKFYDIGIFRKLFLSVFLFIIIYLFIYPDKIMKLCAI